MRDYSLQFNTVLLLSDKEEHLRLDRTSIKMFAPRQVVALTSATEAIDFLNSQTADMVLLDTMLEDMDGIKLLKLLRQNMKLKRTPVVMVTNEGHKHKVLDAITAGCDGYILRPYSLETYKRHLSWALQIDRINEIEEEQLSDARELLKLGEYDDAIEAFEEIVSEHNEAQQFYDLGCRMLVEQNYGQAIVAFKKAIKINDLYADAYKGLAEAYMAKSDTENYRYYLQKASEIFAEFNRLEEAKEAFVDILKYDNKTPNPFNSLGVKLRRLGDLPGALHAYQQALQLTPDDENIYYNIAKAYYILGDLQNSNVHITRCLEMNSHFEEAKVLFKKIFGMDWAPSTHRPDESRRCSKTASQSRKDI
ncbi:tetratricopeptide repeat protein [Desulfovibrio inopinatus]|uniref:tetratricopeptide repeat protein n=1 Tax=Desulfovibrio inopinatus TaxID=102109 RepID=UPI0005503F37|nr:tetratricopeptide repeat protein [Desulfovibrio inopinatus]